MRGLGSRPTSPLGTQGTSSVLYFSKPDEMTYLIDKESCPESDSQDTSSNPDGTINKWSEGSDKEEPESAENSVEYSEGEDFEESWSEDEDEDGRPVDLFSPVQPQDKFTDSFQKLWGAGSKIEERNLLALIDQTLGPKTVAQSHRPTGNIALADYQMRLMLLEQQNKKRLLMARQEQDSKMADAGVHSHLNEPPTPYFDRPEWMGGKENPRHVLSNIPLYNLDLYLEKNKDISFLVYRDFDKAKTKTMAEAPSNNLTSRKHLTYRQEPYSCSRESVGTPGRILQYAPDFPRVERVACAVLVHSRSKLDDIRETLPLPAQAQLKHLTNFVEEHYRQEYAEAGSLLS
ncbi:hypothetical protein K469DRAFT_686249 [Zopfia rhizophila CBS 207.26]|uniref:Uncharacterized protein n=1 Tax=Zopfia rhizophila CBS 207.26 TaxID=1314779 RepID=A0A6A6E924_9PEZI|nr:hypothetical protein K469DRAFT_686249 [Zopfia rhizophila CBS 207.26]